MKKTLKPDYLTAADVSCKIAVVPNWHLAHLQYASLSVSLNNNQAANEAYKKTIELSPNYWISYSHYGAFLFREGLFKEAHEVQLKALLLSPKNPKVLTNLGANQLALGDFEQAIDFFERSLEYAVRSSTYANLGAMYYFTGSFKKAVEMYEAAIMLEPDYLWNWEGLHASYRFLGGEEEKEKNALKQALKYAEISYSINSQDALTMTILGVLKTRAGNGELGRDYINSALEIDPEDMEGYKRLFASSAD